MRGRDVVAIMKWVHSPYSRILHIGTTTRQLLLIADRECNCWFFFISNKFNGLIINMEYAMICPYRVSGETNAFISL